MAKKGSTYKDIASELSRTARNFSIVSAAVESMQEQFSEQMNAMSALTNAVQQLVEQNSRQQRRPGREDENPQLRTMQGQVSHLSQMMQALLMGNPMTAVQYLAGRAGHFVSSRLMSRRVKDAAMGATESAGDAEALAAGEEGMGMGGLAAGALTSAGIAVAGYTAYKALQIGIAQRVQKSTAEAVYKYTAIYSKSFTEKATKDIELALQKQTADYKTWELLPIVGHAIESYKVGVARAAASGAKAQLAGMEEAFKRRQGLAATRAILEISTEYSNLDFIWKGAAKFGVGPTQASQILQSNTAAIGLRQVQGIDNERSLFALSTLNPWLLQAMPSMMRLAAPGAGVVGHRDFERLAAVLETQGVTGGRLAEQLQTMTGALMNIAKQGGAPRVQELAGVIQGLRTEGVRQEAIPSAVSGLTQSAQGRLQNLVGMFMPGEATQAIMMQQLLAQGGGTLEGAVGLAQRLAAHPGENIQFLSRAAHQMFGDNKLTSAAFWMQAGVSPQVALQLARKGTRATDFETPTEEETGQMGFAEAFERAEYTPGIRMLKGTAEQERLLTTAVTLRKSLKLMDESLKILLSRFQKISQNVDKVINEHGVSTPDYGTGVNE